MTRKLLFLFLLLFSLSTARAAVYYVDGTGGNNANTGTGSWAAAKKDIQNAINAAAAGDEIWVKAGTYLPTLDPNGNASPTDPRDKTFYITSADIKLYGGFAGTETLLSQRNAALNVTTLSGNIDLAGNNDAYHVLLTIGRTSACMVDRFTISGGRADVSSSFSVTSPVTNVFRSQGGGMYNLSSSPSVSSCTFSSNSASNGGGMSNSNSSPSVNGCTFSSNSASIGGGMYNTNSNPSVSSCTFSSNTASNRGGGMNNSSSSSPSVSGCTFSANSASIGGGIGNVFNSNPTVSGCTFSANTASGDGGGMYNSLNSSPTVSSCTFSANTATNGGGLYNTTDAGGSVLNCILYGNSGGPAARQDLYKDGTTLALTVSYSLIGDYSAGATNNYTASNIIAADPLFVDAATPAGADGVFMTADDGLRIGCASPARDGGTGTTPTTDILGNARVGVIDMGAYENPGTGCPLYVDGTNGNNANTGNNWAAAKKDVQAAINAVAAGGEVWVKAGTYLPTMDANGNLSPTDPRDKSFYITTKNVKLYGGFAGTETLLSQRNPATNVTILSGDLDGAGGTADAYHVVLTINRSNACVVDGFTITGGRANSGGFFRITALATNVYRPYGGGMFNYSSSPTVRNCVFSDNTTTLEGGGMYNVSSSPTVSGCTFSANTAGYGGGMYNSISSPVLSNCVFSANTAGAHGGGMYNFNNTPMVSNCVFSANSAIDGGGMYNNYGSPTMNSCTFSANTASTNGGGMYNESAAGGGITNCILYDNTGGPANRQNIYKDGTNTTLTVSYSLIGDYDAAATNNYTATNVFAGDPLFVNALNPVGADGIFGTADDGLALQGCSPAINAGTGTTPTTDISGNNRVGAIDLGAYEYQGSPVAAALAAATGSDTRVQQGGSVVSFGGCGAAIAEVLSTGASPVTGSITAQVYVESTAPAVGQTPYVRRHYDISPATSPNTATAQITLYFTQADFDDYNTVRGTHPSLPLNAADAAGNKANVQITQEHGTSATGGPGSYSGWNGTGPAKVLIAPASVGWNATALRWEVTFPVTGFSGFFLHSGLSTPLPVKLLAFSAQWAGDHKVRVAWQTADEEPNTNFVVERSGDGKTFSALGALTGQGGKDNSYQLYDEAPLLGNNYYRLQIAAAGNTSYSQTVIVRNIAAKAAGMVTAAPNPSTDRIVVSCPDKSLQGREAVVLDAQGRLMARVILAEETVLDVRQWSAGVYLLRLPDGSSLRLVKR